MQLSVEEFKAKAGSEIGVSPWILVDQAMIDAFAHVTGDHQFIHVNPELAEQTPFGGTVAHGLLTLSLLPQMAYSVIPDVKDTKFGVNYGYNRIRFVAPVKNGKRIRGRFTLKSVEETRPGQLVNTYNVTVEIEGEERPAVSAEWVTMLFVETMA